MTLRYFGYVSNGLGSRNLKILKIYNSDTHDSETYLIDINRRIHGHFEPT